MTHPKKGPKGQPQRKVLAEARATTVSRRSAPRLDVNPVESVQETLDGLVADMRFTQKMVDQLTEDDMWRITYQRDLDGTLVETGRMPNEWIRLRDDYRDSVAALAGSMVARGIAEKAVSVRAAQAALVATMVKEAARRAGLNPDQLAALGTELRNIAEESMGGRIS